MVTQMGILELTDMLYGDKTSGVDREFNERLLDLQADFGHRCILGSTVAYKQALKEFRDHVKYLVSMYIKAMNEARDRLDCKPTAEQITNLTSKGEQIIDGEWDRWKSMLCAQFRGQWLDEIHKVSDEQKTRVHTNVRLLLFPISKEGRRSSLDTRNLVDPVVCVFVSSTIQDLQGERAAVVRAIHNLRLQPVFSESFGARSESPDQVIFDRLDTCSIYVGIFGSRYGSVPDGTGGKSVTHREFEHARGLGLDILVFEQTGITDREPSLLELLKQIKEYKEGCLVDRFDTIDELEEKVDFALLGLLAKRFAEGSRGQGSDTDPGDV